MSTATVAGIDASALKTMKSIGWLSLRGVNLRNCQLNGSDLDDIDFSSAVINKVKFSPSLLKNIKFSSAFVTYGHFSAHLENVNFSLASFG